MSSYETKINCILAEMRGNPNPNYLWYSLRLQAVPMPPVVYRAQAVATVGNPGPTNDEILRSALGEVANSMVLRDKKAFVDVARGF